MMSLVIFVRLGGCVMPTSEGYRNLKGYRNLLESYSILKIAVTLDFCHFGLYSILFLYFTIYILIYTTLQKIYKKGYSKLQQFLGL